MPVSAEDLTLSAYSYDLPEELIAQTPAERREASRLMVYQRQTQQYEHRHFSDLTDILQPGDLLVLNNTRVFPARIFGQKAHTGTRFEFLLLRQQAPGHWFALAKNSKRIRPGYCFDFAENVQGHILACHDGGQVELRFEGPAIQEDFWGWLERHGEIPYPPYITARKTEDERYQTVFAEQRGSVAAPTAGLHFTPELIASLQAAGIGFCYVTLHVGIGTFSPVRTEDILAHEMHSEWYQLSATTAERLNQQRAAGKRIIAVGTTSLRTLETVWREHAGQFQAASDETRLFIYPGQTIGSIDGLITNFHLPGSTLLMLVSTWIGRKELLRLYQEAISERYRFFSFGDAMLLL
ncbi:MAG: tRNA preQ1(34) S-adenosylmethionine ribosyltransferase-isomerase QueA [Candidatus Sericytochromatia bacterium]|nr:tRNA preQ1(34) S-adenosylmethionine ribosyltransferase-isomerase QueA [Candidatus Sericytochromatia bacterium]